MWKLQFASWRRAVDSFSHRDEPNTHRLEFIEQRHEVAEIPSEAVKSPTHQHVELPPLRRADQLIECGPAVLRTADSPVNELDGGPASRFDVAPEFLELVFRFLVQCAHSCVNRSSHSAP
jgi:hypothetical protein